ncbi:MAG: 4Fe-4S binding protein [Deltaproteobacteria bacterium]|nr:4Fe-4S binding protein [Deltaproteobacteria bacterium]
MADDLYDRLSDIFNMIGFGSRRSPELEALLKALFTREEAELAVNLSPMAPEPPGKLAERIGKDPDAVARMLDAMADKGVIYSSKRNGENWYKLIQLVPGIFELQFMKGEYTDHAKKIARLFDAYAHARVSPVQEEAKLVAAAETVHFARVIPIEQTITPQMNIFPFEVASQYIKDADVITVSTCYCRHEKRLLDRGCKYPDDVCLQLGPFAEFVKERGFGREITQEEALKIMKKSADAGLIHTSSNTQERIDFICNCCTCCCGILQGVSFHHAPVRTVSSNYEAVVDADACTGCGVCVDVCQMNAISVDTGIAEINLNRCIGCGVCVYHCAQEAVLLKERSDFVEPPKSFRELIQKQAQGKK